MEKEYEQDLMAFAMAYVQPEEIEHCGWVGAVALASKRDLRAADSLRMDCEG